MEKVYEIPKRNKDQLDNGVEEAIEDCMQHFCELKNFESNLKLVTGEKAC